MSWLHRLYDRLIYPQLWECRCGAVMTRWDLRTWPHSTGECA